MRKQRERRGRTPTVKPNPDEGGLGTGALLGGVVIGALCYVRYRNAQEHRALQAAQQATQPATTRELVGPQASAGLGQGWCDVTLPRRTALWTTDARGVLRVPYGIDSLPPGMVVNITRHVAGLRPDGQGRIPYEVTYTNGVTRAKGIVFLASSDIPHGGCAMQPGDGGER